MSDSTERTPLPAAAIIRVHNEVQSSRASGVPVVGFLAVEDVQAVLKALTSAESRILAALDAMDASLYGDPEVPFRMRRALTGTIEYQSTDAYEKSIS